MDTIRTAIIEDDVPFAEAFHSYFSRANSPIQCLAVYHDAESAIANIPRDPPDVVVVDLHLPKVDGIECIRRLKTCCPSVQFLVVTAFDEDKMVFDALKAGASGYLLKRVAPAEIANAIWEVRAGGAPMSPHIARQVVGYFHSFRLSSRQDTLTGRERQVIELLATGMAYKEIGIRLDLSFETVRSYVKKIYEKLHAHSRHEAVMKYRGEQ